MTWLTDDHADFKGLYIDRKMLGILLIFVIIGVILVSILVMATSSMSGLRAYSTMQSYWTEARKDGTNSLIHFAETGEPYHLDDYKKSTELIHDAQDLRVALMADSPDYDTAREKLLAIHVHPRDVSSMIKVFERMHSLEHFSDAIRVWDDSDNMVKQLDGIAGELTELIEENGPLNEQQAEAYIGRILEVDERLREYKDVIAGGLSEGTWLLQNIMIWLSVSLVVILMLAGFIVTRRVLNSIEKWAGMLEESEQRYKSLFERNPHSVFSINRGRFIKSGNEIFKDLTGYEENDFQSLRIEELLAASEVKKGFRKLQKVFSGNSQDFEIEWENRSGKKIPMYVTALPIYVDDEINGAFFIAEDISFQKYAEKKIKQQLEEKTFLLSEVHDRVKNNMALMLSMLQLQDKFIKDKKARLYLNRTTSRIRSMALVHENMYQNESFSSIRIDRFIRNVTKYTKENYREQNTDLAIRVKVKPLIMDIKQAIPFGLMLNELVVNIFKPVFDEVTSGTMSVSLVKKGKQVVITVADNGTGRSKSFNPDKTSPLGMTLIETLLKNFNGELEFIKTDSLEARVTFTDENNILRPFTRESIKPAVN
ncbi:MAG: histidine kinase dimerization/phosphoacceptor domain -containing protein [Balneolaceae bacterium]